MNGIRKVDTPSLDLRLLAVLDRLLVRCSVGAAARDLGMPQATLSRCLVQLRQHFGDRLFVRTREGMAPTPAALAAAEPVRRMLDIYRDQLAHPDRFDPAIARRTFSVAASDFGHLLVLPRLHARIADQAPRVSLSAVGLGGDRPLIGMLESGEADIAVGGFPALFAGVKQRKLFRERYVCLVRTEHPAAARGRISAAELAEARHIIVSARSLGHVHQAIEKLLIERLPPEAIALTTGSFVLAALMAGKADLVLTVPSQVAVMLGGQCHLCVVKAPSLDLRPFDVMLYWHERFDADPAHRWLRAMVTELGPYCEP